MTSLVEQLIARGWTRVVSRCGGCVGAVLGSEIHVEFIRTGVVKRDAVREFLEPLLEPWGFLTTRCFKGDRRTRRFLEKLSFKSTWSDDEFEYFILTALPFSKEK